MKSLHRFAIAVGLALVAGVVSLVAAPSLPDQLVTNWDAAGQPNGTMPKAWALWLAPGLTVAVVGLFALVPRIDPLRENIAEFRPYYDWFVVVFAAFMLVVHAGVVAFNLGYEFPFTHLMLAGLALVFYYLGVLLPKAKRNWFVGIRTPWTLSSDAVWDRVHRLGGRLFKLTAVLTLVGLAFGEYAIYFLLVPGLLTAGITLVYSYYLYERLERGGEDSPDADV